MMFWRAFHSINEDVASFLGFTLNILLLFVIKKMNIKAMQQYNILLIQCCVVDLIQVFLSFIVKPVIVIHHKSLYNLTNGFLRPIGGYVEMLGILAWVTSVFFCINSMPVSYIFRYRTLCLHKRISAKFYITSLIVAFFSASTFGIVSWVFHYTKNQHLLFWGETNIAWLMADDDGKVKTAVIYVAVCFIQLS